MNLEELKALKEKADAMVQTLKNDREILENEKKAVNEKNAKDFQDFIESLTPYAALINDNSHVSMNIAYIGKTYSRFTDKGYFYNDDCKVSIYENHIWLEFSGSDVGYTIHIYSDRVEPKCWQYRKLNDTDVFQKFILANQEGIKASVEQIIERYFEAKVEDAKEKNDKLYSDIVKMS